RAAVRLFISRRPPSRPGCARGNAARRQDPPVSGKDGNHPFRRRIFSMIWPFFRRRPKAAGAPATAGCRRSSHPQRRASLVLEALEDRVVPYAVVSASWADPNLSFSFAPDGTTWGGNGTSSLVAELNAVASTATWQREFARALQTWADVTNLNFHLVSDDGTAQGTSGRPQGDSRFGDIRLGAMPDTSGALAWTYYPNTYDTSGGDITLNTNYTFAIGSGYDLYSTLLHESGHALGMAHSTDSSAVMYPYLIGAYTSP